MRCRVVDTSIRWRRDLPHGSVNRIGLSRPMNGWRTGAAPDATKCFSGQFLSRALQARVRRMACVSSSAVSGEPSWSVTCEKWKDANSWNCPDIGCHFEHRHSGGCARQPNSRRSRLSSSAMMALSLHGIRWFRSALSRRCDE